MSSAVSVSGSWDACPACSADAWDVDLVTLRNVRGDLRWTCSGESLEGAGGLMERALAAVAVLVLLAALVVVLHPEICAGWRAGRRLGYRKGHREGVRDSRHPERRE